MASKTARCHPGHERLPGAAWAPSGRSGWSTARPTPTGRASGRASGTTAGPTFESPAFAPGGRIPRRFTCDGRDVSPRLAWSGFGAEVAEYAVVVTDRDAAGFVHWVVAGIPGDARGLPQGAGDPAGDWSWRQGANDFGRRGWADPAHPDAMPTSSGSTPPRRPWRSRAASRRPPLRPQPGPPVPRRGRSGRSTLVPSTPLPAPASSDRGRPSRSGAGPATRCVCRAFVQPRILDETEGVGILGRTRV